MKDSQYLLIAKETKELVTLVLKDKLKHLT